ncbi:MAG: peptidase MA family metallohydrolase [Gemmatimonadales bacterium]
MRSWRGLLGAAALALAGVTCAGRPGAGGQDPAKIKTQLTRALARGNPALADSLLRGREGEPYYRFLAGVAAMDRGRVARAESLFTGATGDDRWPALARRAELAWATGDHARSLALADSVATALEATDTAPPRDWLALGIAYRILGAREPAQFKDALVAFDRAVAGDSGLIEAHHRLGRLFLEKYNGPDARSAFGEVVKRDPGNPLAELGLVEAAMIDGARESFDRLDRVAKAAPWVARVHALVARMDLDAEQFAAATAAADRALERDSTLLEAWGTKAAAALLQGDSAAFQRAERSVAAWHRAPAPFYAVMAEAVARQRRYRLAERMARRGAELDPTDPNALTALGINQLRLGAIDSGRAALARAFERDPYHTWNKNTLDLFDLTAGFRTIATGRFVFVARPDEAELLTLYLAPLLERAYDSLAARYRYRPPTPIRLELYHDHNDFSVRTVGVEGLGALGVSFGTILAMDTPSARAPGDFNWASTAWHELTHTFTLGVTDHKVPRWLSEGLSVLEERRARPGWGANASVAFVAALNGNQLKSVARMNDGFVRPRTPADIGFAYYQASLLCEYLEQTFGFQSILDLLAGHRDGLDNDAAMARATKVTVDQLSPRFDKWLRDRFAGAMKGVGAIRDTTMTPGELPTLMAAGARLKAAGQLPEAIAAFERADKIFPDMADPESPAWALAEIHREQGNLAKAAEYYARVTRLSESHLEANRREAEVRTSLGDHAGAFAAWERAIYIHPYELEMHVKAAEAAARAGNRTAAVRERRAVLTMNPSDRAGARYELALAYKEAGDREAARREVLKALEEAPSFEKAQALLLELRRGGT